MQNNCITQINSKINHTLLVSDPNFSVMMPGKCNAKCDFCFWDRDNAANKSPLDKYAQTMYDYIMDLPFDFRQLSLTGGEPTISPVFLNVLSKVKILKEINRIDKVVLTTNGVKLDRYVNEICESVDHVNISRHHYDEEENRKIYKTKSVPTSEQIKKTIPKFHKKGVDICFNCVVPPTVSVEFCEKFIEYAKKIGVVAVNFRLYHNSMEESPTQKLFEKKYGAANIATCPVCRTASMWIDKFQVNFKYSVLEPTKHWNGIYELVMQPNGDVSSNWSGTDLVTAIEINSMLNKKEQLIYELIQNAGILVHNEYFS